MNFNQFPVQNTYFISPLELAAYIENTMGEYLIGVEPKMDSLPKGGEIALPKTGIAIVHAAVARIVEETSSKWSRRITPTFEEMLAPFIQEAWRNKHEIYEQFRTLLIDLRTDVRIFVGNDPWIMHFFKTRGYDILIEKSVDFRIADWERRMQSGEWKKDSQGGEASPNEQSLRDEIIMRQREREEKARHNAGFGQI